jgi:hypothetical protein
VVHPAGTPGELVIDNSVFALKPVADRKDTTLATPVGAAGTPESITPTPNVRVTFGVTVNEAVPTLPRLSVTVIG